MPGVAVDGCWKSGRMPKAVPVGKESDGLNRRLRSLVWRLLERKLCAEVGDGCRRTASARCWRPGFNCRLYKEVSANSGWQLLRLGKFLGLRQPMAGEIILLALLHRREIMPEQAQEAGSTENQ